MANEHAQRKAEAFDRQAGRLDAKLAKVRDLDQRDLSPEELDALIAWGQRYSQAS